MKLIFVGLFFFAGAVQAAETAVMADATSTARFDWSQALEKIDANYSALFLGPNLQSMEGNLDGRGTNVSLRNYFSLDMEVAPKWEIESGWEVRQYWRPVDPKNPTRKDFDPRDPYIGFSRKDIVKNDRFSLSAKARYFIPVSDYTKNKIGRVDDNGNGELNGSITPSLRFLDGDLGVSCAIEAYYKFDKQAAANRENYSVKAKPIVSYRFARKFAAKVEYNTGPLRHTNDGKWSKFNDHSNGHKIYAGVTYYPTSSLSFNPALGWGSDTFRLNRAEVSLYASYYFL